MPTGLPESSTTTMSSTRFFSSVARTSAASLLAWMLTGRGVMNSRTGKSAMAFLASLVPFGPFVLDRRLAADEAAAAPAPVSGD